MWLLKLCYDKDSSEERKCHKYFLVLFKIFLFSVCLSGFIYQETEFLNFYFTYPEVIDTSLELLHEIQPLSATFCLTESLSRKRYCEKYSDNCEDIPRNHTICKDFPYYCSSGEINQIPRGGIRIAFDDEVLLQRNLSEILRHAKSQFYEVEITGPIYYGYMVTSDFIQCYTVNLLQHNDEELIRRRQSPFARRIMSDIGILDLMFTIELDDSFSPLPLPQIFFKLHEPLSPTTPMKSGMVLERHLVHNLQIHLEEEEHLLPFPYPSDCFNYTHLWESNNKTGPRSQKQCTNLCGIKMDCQIDGPQPFVEYPLPDSCADYTSGNPLIDIKDDELQSDDAYEVIESLYLSCMSQCKPDCVKRKYEFSIEAVDLPEKKALEKVYSSAVIISLKTAEVRVLKHRPQYQTGDLFSNTGGYLGLWIGLSVLAVSDIIKYCYTFVAFCCRRLKSREMEQEFVSSEHSEPLVLTMYDARSLSE